jgi:hypothetical protein
MGGFSVQGSVFRAGTPDPEYANFDMLNAEFDMNRPKAGFTLIEIIVALGVFMLGFVSVMSLYFGGYRSQEHARVQLTQSLIAENVFGSLKEPEIAGLKTAFTGVTVAQTAAIQESGTFPGYSYFYTYEPYGTDASDKRRLFVTIYVFESKHSTMCAADYSALSDEEKAEYDRKCSRFYTILEMEAEE